MAMKNDLASLDLFETRRLSLFSDKDLSFVKDLYLPLIGAKAYAVYSALLGNEGGVVLSHEKLLRNLQLSPGEFVSAVAALEATGLVVTYLASDDKTRLFSYCLYAPLSPKAFFADPLFAGTLRKYIGKDDCEALAKKYALDCLPLDYMNVSESFISYFSPDFHDKSYGESLLSSGSSSTSDPVLPFESSAFISHLHESDPRFSLESFSKEELSKLSRYAALYGYNAEAMGDFAKDCYSFTKPYGKRLDFYALAKACQDNIRFSYLKNTPVAQKAPVKGDSSLARTIRAMQRLTPASFLSHLQKGNKPAPSDLELVRELVVDMGLTPEVANALVFYVLTKKDNTLPKAYTEKIAGSLVREGIVTALDAMNYFTKGKNASYKPAYKERPVSGAKEAAVPVIETPKEENPSSDNEEVSASDFDKVVSSFHWKRK